MNRKQIFFLMFCGLLAVLGFLTISHYGSANQLFSGAYRPSVEQYNLRQQDEKPQRATNEPRAQGIHERDIRKSRGDRYSAY